MSLTSEEAVQRLTQVAQIERRSAVVYGYRQSAVHFFIWAAVWAVGYAVTWFSPSQAGRIWIVVVLFGMAGSFLVGLKAGSDARLSRPNGLRILGVALVAQFFMGSVMAVIHGQGWEVAVLWPLLIGALYTTIGFWVGVRYIVTGIALMILTLVGFFYLPQYFCLWMAVVGSGALLLGGVWLRTV